MNKPQFFKGIIHAITDLYGVFNNSFKWNCSFIYDNFQVSPLDILLKNMEPVLDEQEYVFCTLSEKQLEESGASPEGMFREAEGITVILEKQFAEDNLIAYAFVSRKITLNVHSSLEAIGFLASITGRLADAGISVNPVSAFYHDHLFVEAGKASEAHRILNELAEGKID